MREMVLRDPLVHEAMEAEAAGGRKMEAVVSRARGIIRKMIAQLNYTYIDMFEYVMLAVWRITGVRLVYDPAELDPVREAARRGPLVLCPMHRSHADYILVSQILYENGLVVPHIAAGENLSFWPLGHIFRHMGAFFIRRTFKGDPLYPAVFRAYMKRLLREGWTQEFFIEGTRSRTGKMLPPKLGMLSAIVDAYRDRASDDVQFVPISIMYEKVVEGGSYMKELMGAGKAKEDLAALIRTTGVLTSKYGNIYVRFGTPISLKSFLMERGIRSREQAEAGELRKAVEALGYHITHSIGGIAIVAPTPLVATVLLTASSPLDEDEITERAAGFLDLIKIQPGVRLSPALYDMKGAMRECIKRFERDHWVIRTGGGYSAAGRSRLQLDYYKNSMLHFILPDAMAACTITTFPGFAAPLDEVARRSMRLGDILRYEFNYEVNVTFGELYERELRSLISRGFVEVSGGGVALHPRAETLAAITGATLHNFLESYFIACESLALLRRGPLESREFVKRAQLLGRAMMEGGKLRFVESLSRQNIENALSLMEREGIVEVAAGGDEKRARPHVSLAPGPDSEARASALRADLMMFLGSRGGDRP
jgi:glycerol-3-phosphate O-acyltransferase